MSNDTLLRGLCPSPFFQESMFPTSGGYILGRFCAKIPGGELDTSCCLPCPAADWVYPDNFYSLTRIPGFLSIGGLALCVFMLACFIFLPVQKTRRHYLNVCLVVGIVLLQLGFVVPVADQPQECYNQITPNDMYSSMTCAWSGALVVAGGAAINTWILIRALSMHLQVCWDIMPGTLFFYAAQIFGWGLSGVLLATCFALTGVSFRFGDYCHINHQNSLKTFWGPLLGFAGLSLLLQMATFIYCLQVYLKNLNGVQKVDTGSSRKVPSTLGSARTQKARAVYRRVRKVMSLQWRSLLLAIVVTVHVVYFSIVFVYLDQQAAKALKDINTLLPWIECMVTSNGNRNKCAKLGIGLGITESTLIATLCMVAVPGIEAFILLGRVEMVTGWIDKFRGGPRQHEFVSVDALQDAEKRPYEIIKVSTPTTTIASPYTDSIKSPPPVFTSPRSPQGDSEDYFGRHSTREYRTPSGSYSTPLPPISRPSTMEGGPSISFAAIEEEVYQKV